jgi:hypothetical protein
VTPLRGRLMARWCSWRPRWRACQRGGRVSHCDLPASGWASPRACARAMAEAAVSGHVRPRTAPGFGGHAHERKRGRGPRPCPLHVRSPSPRPPHRYHVDRRRGANSRRSPEVPDCLSPEAKDFLTRCGVSRVREWVTTDGENSAPFSQVTVKSIILVLVLGLIAVDNNACNINSYIEES